MGIFVFPNRNLSYTRILSLVIIRRDFRLNRFNKAMIAEISVVQISVFFNRESAKHFKSVSYPHPTPTQYVPVVQNSNMFLNYPRLGIRGNPTPWADGLHGSIERRGRWLFSMTLGVTGLHVRSGSPPAYALSRRATLVSLVLARCRTLKSQRA